MYLMSPTYCFVMYLAVSLDDVQLVELARERLVDAPEEKVLLHLAQPLRRTFALLLAHQEVHLCDRNCQNGDQLI